MVWQLKGMLWGAKLTLMPITRSFNMIFIFIPKENEFQNGHNILKQPKESLS
jgi:hypothetical protein